MDEIFGRKNFVQMISIKRASPAGFKVINPGPLTVTDYILLYAKDKDQFNYFPQRIPVEYDENYDLYIENPKDNPGNWILKKLVDVLYEKYNFKDWKDAKTAWGLNWKVVRNSLLGDLAIEMSNSVVSIRDPHKPSEKIKNLMIASKSQPGKVFIIERENYDPIYIYNGGSLSFYKEKLREINGILTPTELLTDFWDDMNFAGIAKEGGVQFKNGKKPEMLISVCP
jgi:adenine-specific DNA-methyltransferase